MLNLCSAKLTRIILLIAAGLLLLAAACGGDDDVEEHVDDTATPTASADDTATPTAPPDDTATPTASADDTATPTAPPDDTATPTTPADEIESQPSSPQAIGGVVTEASGGALQTAAGDNFYTLNNLKVPLNETTTISIDNEGVIPHNMRIAGADGEWNTADDSVSDPDLILGGQSAVVEFTPTLAGTYTFRCDIHPAEQGGVIVVG